MAQWGGGAWQVLLQPTWRIGHLPPGRTPTCLPHATAAQHAPILAAVATTSIRPALSTVAIATAVATAVAAPTAPFQEATAAVALPSAARDAFPSWPARSVTAPALATSTIAASTVAAAAVAATVAAAAEPPSTLATAALAATALATSVSPLSLATLPCAASTGTPLLRGRGGGASADGQRGLPSQLLASCVGH